MSDEQNGNGKGVSKKFLAGTSGSVLAVTTAVYAYIDSKVSDLEKRIETKATTEYVDGNQKAVQTKLENIERLLVTIDGRVYDLLRSQK